jgi:pilus assembly protein Flp/PilA
MSFDTLAVFFCKFISQGRVFSCGTIAMRTWFLRWTTEPVLLRFIDDASGATAIEYGLIAAGISVAIIAVVQGLGTKLTSTFTSVQNALN